MRLRRFWLEFERTDFEDLPPGLSLGCGVTAWTLDDALGLVRERIFRGAPLPRMRECTVDVDVSTLDQGHVVPNMLPPNWRGIWFPMGYDW